MTDLPEPLVPEDCDLRDFPFMPLEVARFRDSDLASLPDAEARWANVMAWAASWHQLPAGSLPNDDAALCRLLGYGRDIKLWQKIRAAGGLRGWVECADSRLYHPVVAEKALDAWGKKQVQRKRSKAGNDARWGSKSDSRDESEGGQGSGKEPPRGPQHDPQGILQGSHKESFEESLSDPQGNPSRILGMSQGTGRGTVEEREKDSEAKASAAAVATAPADAPPPDARTALWREGLSRLQRLTGKPDGSCRKLLGQFLKTAGDDCSLVASVLFEAERLRPMEVVPWVEGALRAKTRPAASQGPAATRRPAALANTDWMRPMMGYRPPSASPSPSFDFDGHAEETIQ